MGYFIARRLIWSIPVLLLSTLLVFAIVNIIPGDPVSLFAEEGMLTPEAEAALRDRLNLDDPVGIRYAKWLGHVVQGDLGRSYRARRPVTEMILDFLPITLQLGGASLFVALVVGIPFGILSALKRNSWVDVVSRWVALAGLGIPNFFLGILLILTLTYYWPLFPASGFVMFYDNPWEAIRYTALPAIALGTSSAAVLFRQTRGALLEVLGEDYVRTARAKGLPGRTVIMKHAFRNAVLPVLTILGLHIGRIASGSVVTEQIFSVPGIGRAAIGAINSRDIDLMQGVIMMTVFGVIAANLITDMLYAVLDPRIRYS